MTSDVLRQNIKRMRIERHLSQEKLAARSDVSTQEISNIERGKVDPKVSIILKIARGLSVTPDVLLCEFDAGDHTNTQRIIDISVRAKWDVINREYRACDVMVSQRINMDLTLMHHLKDTPVAKELVGELEKLLSDQLGGPPDRNC